jgi:2-polyprenyl-3-methyl-5-hydroxy-6-metoxy-1,4-benzoquinol methylase
MRHKFNLGGLQRGRFLDIGCSEGAYVAGSIALGWTATGVEIDDAKVSRAQARGLDVRRLTLPAAAASLPAAEFVMLRHVLEHVPDFVQFARAAASAVVPGGILWVECPNQAGWSMRHRRKQVREGRYLGALYPPTHVHAFEPTAFRRLAEQIGLSCERIITHAPSHHYWCPPHQSDRSRLKGILGRLAAVLGYGNGVAAIYRKSVRGTNGGGGISSSSR